MDIEIQNYSLNSEETEVKYDNENKEVSPSEVISLISKIENYGENCYVRTKIFYINDDINFKQYVTGMSDEWEKYGEYYWFDYDDIPATQNNADYTGILAYEIDDSYDSVLETLFSYLEQ